MSDIFREVDEEVRRDQAVQLWRKYQNYVIAAALVVVGATAAWKAIATYKIHQAEAAGSRFEAALQLLRDGKSDEAKVAFAAIGSDAPAGYRVLANLATAAATGSANAAAGAAAFDALARDPSLSPALQSLARLRAASLRLDDADLSELKSRLEPLTLVGQPFRNGARELLGYAALKVNDYELAGREFDEIVADPIATTAQRQRAEAMLGLVQAGKATKPH
jgi:hypothetical protein